MSVSLFHIINFLLIFLAIVIGALYVWDLLFGRVNQPLKWKQAIKLGRVSDVVRKLEKQYPDKARFYSWWLVMEQLKEDKVPGDLAEVGVYQGDSARVLHHLAPERVLHLFDTFGGFPEKDLQSETGKAATYTPSHFADTKVGEVLRRIDGNGNIRVWPGYFPDSAGQAAERHFALVNIDVDLYNPTRAALDFFYPRLSPRGVLMVHDYNEDWAGVIRAVDEFVAGIPESMVFFPDKNGTVMIIRNK
ncbi:MAG TPA: TylF/MycF/NovP-related O-methyltransferase [Bacteroidales bacterium]|nr:TylF/MycF/NovP-related O-methyltransferase [Bacteroidales bacterium]HPT10865.1 TylF/MycF/NovP-related O-methyltransferase [Bacteroidales bacterium]